MPPRALRGYVQSMHSYDMDGFPAGQHIGMPSATVTLVIAIDPPLDISVPGAPRRRMSSCLGGLHDRPVTIHHDGVQRGLQLGLTPLALRRLFGLPASELAHQVVSLDDVVGHRAADTLLDRIAAEPTWPARLYVLQADLAQRLDRHCGRGGVRAELLRAWSALSATGGSMRIAELAGDVGWSNRHLTQQFAAAVGVTPKTVARIMRFGRSTAPVRRGHDRAGVAARCRYADQAHMTREWVRLAGTTPIRWPRDDVLANVQDTPPTSGDDR